MKNTQQIQQTRNRGEVPQLIKNTYKNPTANIWLHNENLEAFPLRSGTNEVGMSLSPFLFSIILGFPADVIRQERK